MLSGALFGIAVLLAPALPLQAAQDNSTARVLEFSEISTVQEMNALATLIRAVAEVGEVRVDASRRTFAFSDSSNRAALAEWLFRALDSPSCPAAKESKREFRLPGAPEDATRVFCLNAAAGGQGMMEIATVVRSIGDIRRLFVFRNALVVRGMPGEIALAEWLVEGLDTPAAEQAKESSYLLSGSGENEVRLYRVSKAQTPEQLQKIAVRVRSTARVRRLFVYNPGKILAVRGTAEEIALAGRLLAEM